MPMYTAAAAMSLRDVSAGYDDRLVLEGLDLDVQPGECLVLAGPSGSGKSTVIRLLAGLVRPLSGSVLLAGANVTELPVEERRVALMYNGYGVHGQMTVVDNVVHALVVRGMTQAEARRHAEPFLELVCLEDRATREVMSLSAGEQQRANLARVLALEPDVLLLHEPLSASDEDLRRGMAERLRTYQEETGVSIVMATRDRRDAFRVADRIAVLHGGRLEQVGTPQDLYTRPVSTFVAGLLGETNFLAGKVVEVRSSDGLLQVSTPIGLLSCVGSAAEGASVQVLTRPENLHFVSEGGELTGTAGRSRFHGSHRVTEVQVGDHRVSVLSCGACISVPGPGEPAQLSVRPQDSVALLA